MRAAATSHLLSVIEPHVNQDYVQKIQRILAQPVLVDLVKQAA